MITFLQTGKQGSTVTRQRYEITNKISETSQKQDSETKIQTLGGKNKQTKKPQKTKNTPSPQKNPIGQVKVWPTSFYQQ